MLQLQAEQHALLPDMLTPFQGTGDHANGTATSEGVCNIRPYAEGKVRTGETLPAVGLCPNNRKAQDLWRTQTQHA